jgi:acetyl-CoA carboxylase biotin carboxylase subunit
MFKRVLVANRGEIAVRVIRTLREMGITSIAVHSDVDRYAPHVLLAHETYALEGSTSVETYLNQDRLLEVIKTSKTEAVHPGYGFLSESPAFAEKLETAGVTLIGPPAAVVSAMGDKVEARRRMAAAGVPIVPGFDDPDATEAELLAAAATVGYPLLVKATAGGGGKGMRRVDGPDALPAALAEARSEAERAFSDGRVYLEKLLLRPRHVEIQVMADAHGNVIHLFERDCSIQRRHQKIVEESPSPGLTPELRAAMGDTAVRAAQAIGYRNAGTFEFLVEGSDFYFLEVNARLQVEHPVTELVTGLDLVRIQVEVAGGLPLSVKQADLRQSGHALECRIYAEDPAQGFLPQTGKLVVYRPPSGPGIRVDDGVREGQEITVHYDPLLAKVIVHAPGRDAALDRMHRALSEFVILGVTTNLPFLRALLRDPAFRCGETDIAFLAEHPIAPTIRPTPPEAFAAAGEVLSSRTKAHTSSNDAHTRPNPWLSGSRWRAMASETPHE